MIDFPVPCQNEIFNRLKQQPELFSRLFRHMALYLTGKQLRITVTLQHLDETFEELLLVHPFYSVHYRFSCTDESSVLPSKD